MERELDVIIFGATGFTGKCAVREANEVLKNMKWGVAGRNKEKLEKTLEEVGKKINSDFTKIPIIVADVKDEKSLEEMAKKCKVVVNCCGPYRFYGEPVVKACINAGTHHVDVSGEPQYMELMQLNYDQLAKEKGVYIVSSCGFDSIPADVGTVFVEKHFEGTVNSVETYLETWEKGGNSGGAALHYGTWESAVYGLAHANELRGIRTKLFKEKLPPADYKLKNKSLLHKSSIVKGYCLPFPGSDRSVVLRSQRFFYETEKKRPIQVQAYIAFRSLFHVLAVAFVGLIFGTLSKFSLGRKLLLNYPKLFSFGFASHEGPSEEKMNNTYFTMTFYVKGWPKEEQLAEPTDKHTNPPSKTLIAKVSGKNPGYIGTAIALLASAKVILTEKDKMPGSGGVLPPGAAFAKTSIINELEKYEYGFKFEIVSSIEAASE